MPWCETCSRLVDASADESPEKCPVCGRAVAASVEPAVPWHFKVLVVATVAYLGLRAYQGAVWLLARL